MLSRSINGDETTFTFGFNGVTFHFICKNADVVQAFVEFANHVQCHAEEAYWWEGPEDADPDVISLLAVVHELNSDEPVWQCPVDYQVQCGWDTLTFVIG